MRYQQPPPGGYPPPYYPSSPHSNGSDMLLGSMLGELKSGQMAIVSALGAQTGVLHQIHGRLEENARIMEERLQPPHVPPQHPTADPPPAKREQMTWRDWSQIIMAGLVLGAALYTRLPLQDVMPIVGKLLGF